MRAGDAFVRRVRAVGALRLIALATAATGVGVQIWSLRLRLAELGVGIPAGCSHGLVVLTTLRRPVLTVFLVLRAISTALVSLFCDDAKPHFCLVQRVVGFLVRQIIPACL